MAVRIAGLYLASTLLLLLGLGAGLYLTIERTLLDERRQNLQAYAADDAAFLQLAVGSEGDLVTLAPIIAGSLPQPASGDRRLRIFSANGTLLVSLPPRGPGDPGRPSAATLALLPLSLFKLTLVPEDQPDLVYGAQPILGAATGGSPPTIGVVEAAQARDDIDRVLERLRVAFAAAAGLAALLAVVAGLLLARSVARPVRRLESVATAIAAGDLARRAGGLPRNEIGALGESFNRMAARLADLLAEARREQARLAALLASLTDGVLACDAAGALTLENPAAREMLGVAHGAPRAEVAEAAASLGLAALWRQAMGAAERPAGPAEAEIASGGRALLAVATPVEGGGSVCVVRDITRLRELEQGRAAVLRRLGHELRTPLTALRAVLANLSDGAGPAERAPLATAEAEAARLSRLVEEILALGQGRNAGALALRPADLRALAAAACALFAGRAARLGVSLQGPDAASPPVVVRGDPDRLRQVLVNLLDNAVRHTPPGGHIAVTVAAAGGAAVLAVRDNGEGMDAGTARWAFEPYYQSRPAAAPSAASGTPGGSGAPGGSGLGLAIVREIVAAHGGTVELQSAPGAGTTVTVRLPPLAPGPPRGDPAAAG